MEWFNDALTTCLASSNPAPNATHRLELRCFIRLGNGPGSPQRDTAGNRSATFGFRTTRSMAGSQAFGSKSMPNDLRSFPPVASCRRETMTVLCTCRIDERELTWGVTPTSNNVLRSPPESLSIANSFRWLPVNTLTLLVCLLRASHHIEYSSVGG